VVTAVASRTRGCEALLEAAQAALRSAKEQGGSRVVAGEVSD